MARTCAKCGGNLPYAKVIDGKKRNLAKRKYCLICSPYGKHNTRQLDRPGGVKECAECGLLFSTKKQRICGACQFRKRRDDRLEKMYSLVGTACWCCGYDKGMAARAVLEFHHVDPSQKAFWLSAREVAMMNWEKVLQEMRKCALLCCRCHREQQAGILSDGDIAEVHKIRWQGIDRDTHTGVV